MDTVSIVVCDDNKLHNDYICTVLNKLISGHNLPAVITLCALSAEAVLDYLPSASGIHLYFIDIQLTACGQPNSDVQSVTKTNNEMNGLSLAAEIRRRDPAAYIIFITAHVEYSLEAYKTKTFDYLIKPIHEDQLAGITLRAFGDIEDLFRKSYNFLGGSSHFAQALLFTA